MLNLLKNKAIKSKIKTWNYVSSKHNKGKYKTVIPSRINMGIEYSFISVRSKNAMAIITYTNFQSKNKIHIGYEIRSIHNAEEIVYMARTNGEVKIAWHKIT